MFQVKVGQIWKDKVEADGGTFLIKKVKEPVEPTNNKSFLVEVCFLAGPYEGITKDWYVDSIDTLLADNA